ncbi:MAG: hypothetical protein ACJAW7_003451, partial [Candidatus Azotimanducaceae bacterium]
MLSFPTSPYLIDRCIVRFVHSALGAKKA